MKKRAFLLVSLAAIVAAIAAPFALDRERRDLTAADRAKIPGSYETLSRGAVRYELSGPEAGPPVVLVHGFSASYVCWDKTVPALTDAGFRVLRFDLYGHGYSDRTDVDYTPGLFDEQLDELVEALKFREPFDLIGWSMGGMISARYCESRPESVRKLALIDPAGYPLELLHTVRALRIAGLGEYLIRVGGDRAILDGLRDAFHEPDRYPEFFQAYEDQMAYRGYKRAILSCVRNIPFDNYRKVYAGVGKQDRDVLIVWGKQDQITPFVNHKALQVDIPNAQFHAIDNAGHTPHYESPETVNSILIEFLRDEPKAESPET